jgi:hypothetical protein
MKHRTMQGKEIDMEKLVQSNELTPAIGNMKVNARGDELGAGGKIIRKREEIVADYYNTEPVKTKKASVAKPAPVTETVKTVEAVEVVEPVVSKKKTVSEEE